MKLEIYYDKSENTKELISKLKGYASQVNEKWGVPFRFFEASEIDDTSKQQLENDIRSIPPQVRGKIVTRRNRILPLSGNKKMNLKNTPIILVYDSKGSPVDVYPHMFGMNYIDTLTFLQRLFERGPYDHFLCKGLLEDPIIKILSEDPSLIEEGAKFKGAEVEIPSGRIDILLEDEKGTPIIVEVETEATDQAVGQVCRLTSGYATFRKASPQRLRKAIIFRKSSSNLLQTARGAQVELYKIKFESLYKP